MILAEIVVGALFAALLIPVLPAVLRYLKERRKLTDEKVLQALAVAGLFGSLIKRNASISGAECGCQAEIGSACAMAAVLPVPLQ